MRKNIKYLNALLPKRKTEWSTENEVVYKNRTVKLRRFSTSGIPILILPPQAGHHSNIADFHPKQSLAKTLSEQGFSVYVAHWLEPTYGQKHMTIDDYIKLTDECVDKIMKEEQVDKVNIAGLCQGGWQATIYSSLFPEKISSLTIAASPIDFKKERNFLNTIVENTPMEVFYGLVLSGFGLMRGEYILHGFKGMDPYKNYIKTYADIWSIIDDDDKMDKFENFNNWYETTQCLPGTFYLQVVADIFKDNKIPSNRMKSLGKTVSLENIDMPTAILVGKKDNITAPGQCLALRDHISSEDTLELEVDGGHIGTLTGSKSLKEAWPQVGDFIKRVC